MIAVLLGRELGACLVLDKRPEDRLLALEFTGLVFGIDPIEDGILLVHGESSGGDGEWASECSLLGDMV